jgi:hypothetical protein
MRLQAISQRGLQCQAVQRRHGSERSRSTVLLPRARAGPAAHGRCHDASLLLNEQPVIAMNSMPSPTAFHDAARAVCTVQQATFCSDLQTPSVS